MTVEIVALILLVALCFVGIVAVRKSAKDATRAAENDNRICREKMAAERDRKERLEMLRRRWWALLANSSEGSANSAGAMTPSQAVEIVRAEVSQEPGIRDWWQHIDRPPPGCVAEEFARLAKDDARLLALRWSFAEVVSAIVRQLSLPAVYDPATSAWMADPGGNGNLDTDRLREVARAIVAASATGKPEVTDWRVLAISERDYGCGGTGQPEWSLSPDEIAAQTKGYVLVRSSTTQEVVGYDHSYGHPIAYGREKTSGLFVRIAASAVAA